MINRVLLRIKIIQVVYAFYKGDGKSIQLAEKELLHSVEKAYDLYFHLLQLAIEVTNYASVKLDARKNKLVPTDDDLNPNTRFIDNQFVKQLSENVQLSDYLSGSKLSWMNDDATVKLIYELIMESDLFDEYMSASSSDYEADKTIWRKIFKNIILTSTEFADSIEDQSIYWADDLDIVISFVIKTI